MTQHKMKTYLLWVGVILLGLSSNSCTKYNLTEGPKPIAHHDKTMWEYFSSDPYNWSMTQELIEHAGLRDIFEGKSQLGSDFTFFGITNHSIRAYLLKKKEDDGLQETPQITDLSQDQCREQILSLIYPKRRKLEEWTAGRPVSGQTIGTGGEIATMQSGMKLWIYVYRTHYDGVPEMGPKKIYLVNEDKEMRAIVASSDISTNTGIVHSLDYVYRLFDFLNGENI